MSLFPYIVAAWVFCVGLYGIVTSRNFVHLTMSLVVMQSSTYILLLTIGYKVGGVAPVFAGVQVGTPAVDPVVQALMLTDIVVEATVIALLLALTLQLQKKAGTLNPDELKALEG
jgi:multicomponent Na+:H+ antiporter subunit C